MKSPRWSGFFNYFYVTKQGVMRQENEYKKRGFEMELHIAPLQGISCWAFRASCVGATDSYTEMMEINPLLNREEQGWNAVDTFPIAGQRQWVQVLANSPRQLEGLAKYLHEFTCRHPERAAIYGININAGCPSPAIIAAGEGAALIKRAKRVKRMVKAFIDVPEGEPYKISVKLRLGLNAFEMRANYYRDLVAILGELNTERVGASIVHFKHAAQTSYEQERWELLESVLDLPGTIIINGGIQNLADVRRIEQRLPGRYQQKEVQEKIQGVMIGRAAIRDLNIFSQFGAQASQSKQKIPGRKRFTQNCAIHSPAAHYLQTLETWWQDAPEPQI
jgi:tRNA-dihydrouridine synthase